MILIALKNFQSKSAEKFLIKVRLKIKNQDPAVKSQPGVQHNERAVHDG